MKQLLFGIALSCFCLSCFSQQKTDYIVLSGFSYHFSKPSKLLGSWNEDNYGIGYQRSFKSINSPARYNLEIGIFKDSYSKTATYAAGAFMRDISSSPRISLGGMAGLAYRVNDVDRKYYTSYGTNNYDPNNDGFIITYNNKKLIPIAGLVAQLEIPYTPIVIQTTFLPKIKSSSSATIFTQALISF